ncbi:MAG: RidA family protein [Sneathiella sp.]
MKKRAVIPAEFKTGAENLKMSPGILSGHYLFLNGVTGSDLEGLMPLREEEQFRHAFKKIGAVLKEAGLGFEAMVEMTTYHVGLRDHFELFDKVRLDYLTAPFPAWTAVEVAGLRREGAVVEIRAIAAAENS